jgi:hypothetical protein
MFPPSSTTAGADDRLHPARGHRWHQGPGESAGAGWPDGKYPVPVLAAAILAAEGVSFLLVGSAALWLHGEPIAVGDADLVAEPGEQNLGRLGDALARLALRPRVVPRVRDFPLLDLVSVPTSYGRVDCLLERGRVDWVRLRQSSVRIPVADASVLVASGADVLALRRQFKE